MKQAKRNKEIHVRFTEEEHARLKMLSEGTGKSMGEYIRTVTLNENAVHISDGKEVAKKIGQLHNKLILYHGDMIRRLEELRDSAKAYTAMASQCGNGLLSSDVAQETAQLLNFRVEAAADMLYNAYGEFENQTEEKLQQIIQQIPCERGA